MKADDFCAFWICTCCTFKSWTVGVSRKLERHTETRVSREGTRPCGLAPALMPTSLPLSRDLHTTSSTLSPFYIEMTSIMYRNYMGESDLPHIMALVQHELSEPYVIYTYRYFLHQWCVRSLALLIFRQWYSNIIDTLQAASIISCMCSSIC
jgi:hypothetical protein